MSPEEINSLRREVKSMIAGADLDTATGRKEILAALAADMGKPVSNSTLAMALSGYRLTPSYVRLLERTKILIPSVSEHIHASKGKIN